MHFLFCGHLIIFDNIMGMLDLDIKTLHHLFGAYIVLSVTPSVFITFNLNLAYIHNEGAHSLFCAVLTCIFPIF